MLKRDIACSGIGAVLQLLALTRASVFGLRYIESTILLEVSALDPARELSRYAVRYIPVRRLEWRSRASFAVCQVVF